ncbi:MAG TPA: pilus assembly protein CpaE [Actinotalea sp.]|nr:pilus assembly protein CpaE [Actinotalea sp.]
MISEHLAAALQDAGLRWNPTAGDRFVIPQPELDGELFTLSEMTIEAREYPTGTVLGFNGTTEWALDSVAQDDTLWMPREDQLRDRLGGTFVALVRGTTPDGALDGWRVTTRAPSGELLEHQGETAADAYALALLTLIRQAVDAAPS